ncbi:serine hydrolase domain-containing protein [Paenarthrobacter sp. CM16]|uniref:serine hydrolase domain-containing protein n=1 Tax=Paenarthrobacter sp. CM16 TaxID=2738447 RepID=UPI002811F649|nr:serine hydrolase domain-containing protein [Paenarthrobacter sp. CM16]
MGLAVACGTLLGGCTVVPDPLPSRPATSVKPPATATSAPMTTAPTTTSPPVVPTSTEASSSAPLDTASFSPAFQELRATLELFSREKREEGASAVLISAKVGLQEWTHAAGVRSRDGRTEVQPGDTFAVGGQLRTMLAVSIAKLVEEGALTLDDTVLTHLPGSVAEGSALTIRQLLGITAALPDMTSAQADALLGRLVERLRGSSLEAVLQGDVFGPLDLESTSLLVPGSTAPDDLVHGYIQVAGETVDVTFPSAPSGVAPGGLVSSIEDISTFYEALLTGRLVEPASLIDMKGAVPANYGLGLDHWDDRCTNGSYFGHAGDIPGYGSVALNSADGNRRLVIFVAYPPRPLLPQPSAISLEMTGVAQVALNSGCRFQFR